MDIVDLPLERLIASRSAASLSRSTPGWTIASGAGGLGYGITGVALTARVSGAIGGSAGLFHELDAIAAAIIGGTSLAGGRGRVLGAILGALLMGSLNNGMSLMNVPTSYQDTARGIVLLLAVAIDQLSRRRLGPQ